MAWNALDYNRDLMKPVPEIREFESHFEGIISGPCTTSWYEMKRGRVGLCIVTVMPRLHRKDKELSHFQSREAAYAACHGQLAYYRAMAGSGVLREVHHAASLNAHVDEWNSGADDLPIGFIVSMEGAPSVLFRSRSTSGKRTACGCSARLTTDPTATATAPVAKGD